MKYLVKGVPSDHYDNRRKLLCLPIKAYCLHGIEDAEEVTEAAEIGVHVELRIAELEGLEGAVLLVLSLGCHTFASSVFVCGLYLSLFYF